MRKGSSGINLRDWMAGQAFAAFCQGAQNLGNLSDPEQMELWSKVARIAYNGADAMLIEREKRGGKQ